MCVRLYGSLLVWLHGVPMLCVHACGERERERERDVWSVKSRGCAMGSWRLSAGRERGVITFSIGAEYSRIHNSDIAASRPLLACPIFHNNLGRVCGSRSVHVNKLFYDSSFELLYEE